MKSHQIITVLCPFGHGIMKHVDADTLKNIGWTPNDMRQVVECDNPGCKGFGRRFSVPMPELELTEIATRDSIMDRGGVYEAELELKE